MKLKINIIIGSTRLNRIGDQFAEWVRQRVEVNNSYQFECIDLRDWVLPYDDEPEIPATGNYIQSHTQAWSNKITEAVGFIFITPQYNWGYPAVLKNALDHLYKEWHNKPAMIISYANRGGGKAAEQLRQVLIGMKMLPTMTMPELKLEDSMLNNGQLMVSHNNFKALLPDLNQAMKEMLYLLGNSPAT